MLARYSVWIYTAGIPLLGHSLGVFQQEGSMIAVGGLWVWYVYGYLFIAGGGSPGTHVDGGSCQASRYWTLCNHSPSFCVRQTAWCHWTRDYMGQSIVSSDIHPNFTHIRYRVSTDSYKNDSATCAFWCRICRLLLQSTNARSYTHVNWTMDHWKLQCWKMFQILLNILNQKVSGMSFDGICSDS